LYDEVTFNKNTKNYGRIARVLQNVTNNNEVQTWWNMPYPLADELRQNYGSDFKYVVMSSGWGDHMLTFENKKLTKSGGYFENGIAEMLSLKMIRGNQSGLQDPSSIFLSASAAKAYFGDADPMNKMMKIDNELTAKITGVYEDFPRNSDFAELSFIAPWKLLYNNTDWIKTMDDPWRPNAFDLFVQLNDNADFAQASLKIKDAKLKRVNEQLAKKKPALFLHPMSQWHLYSEFKNGVNIGGAIQYVWMFGIIGLFVLLLACINFMNLSTARSEKRAKEVGIRKTVGSLRRQLIGQFFSESLLTVFIAFAIALLLVQLILPYFNEIANKKLTILWYNPYFWIAALFFIAFTGLAAGSYPAFYLSSFRPVKVLKGTFKAGRAASLPRKILVVLQFTVSVTLIIGTIVVYQQIQFAKNRPVGYTRDGLISIGMSAPVHQHFDEVRNDLIKSGAIITMAGAGSPATETWNSTSGFDWKGKDPNLSTDFRTVSVSYDYGQTVAWQIKEGRDFSRAFATDTSAVILNEAAVKFIGFKNPVGETMTWWGNKLTVVGVIHNMIMQSPYEEVRPIIYNLSMEQQNVAILRLNPKLSAKAALSTIEPVFKKINPEQPFEYRFTDEEYAKKFGNEERVGRLAGILTTLAVFISCLGLFGLASFVAEQRTKEIGVRKVLGASVFNVWNLLSKDFVILVTISFLISVPLAYYFMHAWLQNYQYRTELSWWIFAAAGIGSLVITILVVSMQAIKAAVANPVKSLRTE
jgi:putative ABC transport system permease protein